MKTVYTLIPCQLRLPMVPALEMPTSFTKPSHQFSLRKLYILVEEYVGGFQISMGYEFLLMNVF